MPDLAFDDVALLLRRSGFVARRSDIERLQPLSWGEAVSSVLDVSAAPSTAHGIDLSTNRSSWDKYSEMVQFCADRAAFSPTPVVEKMTLFWHGLLPTSLDKVFHHRQLMDQNTLYRTSGMGSIRELYQAMAIEPAMIRYLDNDRNVAGSPNENFARELMELFLLGVGHYTEEDVRSSALAWTGHGLTEDDEHYEFDAGQHHTGPSTFKGRTQVWDGPQIIDHLFDGPTADRVARYLAERLWAFFAYPGPDAGIVSSVAGALRNGSSFDTTRALRAVFEHPQFRSDATRNGLVRSPFEFMVAAMGHTDTPGNVAHPEWYGDDMGQELFKPPNVSGWRPNKYWISSSAAWAKQRFANNLRWKLEKGTHLTDSDRTTDPAVRAQLSLDLFGIYHPTTRTKNALIDYIEAERAARGWGERVGLLHLPLLTPEFQAA